MGGKDEHGRYPESAQGKSATNEIGIYEAEIEEAGKSRKVRFFDTQGLFDTNGSTNHAIIRKLVAYFLKTDTKEIDSILILSSGADTRCYY